MRLIKGVECYGKLHDDSNFSIVCEDEEDDDIWTEGNPNTDSDYFFETWEEVVDTLSAQYDSPIVEISAV
tara:strand:- start:962 stop:1171 length:210 start_codon:yes stop_codon:yes gene_type:complete